jgi:hypothetical protein
VASLNSPALRRRLDALTDAVRERIERRQRMREYAAAAATLRAALTAAGIDPAQNSGLREFGYAERVVAEWPDTPELQRSDAAFIAQDPKLAGRQSLAVKVAERVGRFAGQPPLTGGQACRPSTGTPGRSPPAWGKLRTRNDGAAAALYPLSAPGGGEGWGEVGDSRTLADTHLTLPSLRDGPLPLRPEGRRGDLWPPSDRSGITHGMRRLGAGLCRSD